MNEVYLKSIMQYGEIINMGKTNKSILLFSMLIILFICISSAYASEDILDTQSITDDSSINEDDFGIDENIECSNENSLLNLESNILKEDDKPSDFYINSSKELSGDGLSPETAYKNFDYTVYDKVAISGIIHLSEGNYGVPEGSPYNTNYYIIGQEGTVINSCWFDSMGTYKNFNQTLTFINVSFEVPSSGQVWYSSGNDDIGFSDTIIFYGISMDGRDFNFINCTFINTSFVSGQHQHVEPNRDGLTDICTAIFENCKFLNYTYDPTINSYDVHTSWGTIIPTEEYETTSMITSFECSKFIFNNCTFDNVSCDAIVDSYGGNTDYYGRIDGVYIYNSTFTNCDINGVVKARNSPYCIISNCTYDFPVSYDVPLVGPFYINSTDRPVIKTNLGLVANANTLVISLTDESNNPLVDYEVEIVTNGRVSYEYTDNNGKIILSNLLGNYSFEITYPGDEYEGYAPSKVFKNFTFEKSKLSTVLTAPKVTANYNIAKNLVVTLKDSNNKALANKKVIVKVGSISKVLTTDSKGQVSLNVATLVPKTYTASISFAGDDNYKSSSISSKVTVSKGVSKLIAKAKTFKAKVKTKKFSVTLKDSKNRVLKGKKLTIKVKGKTYTATTNKKGVATFKITKLSKKGTYKSKIVFKGDKWYKAISKTVKIKIK